MKDENIPDKAFDPKSVTLGFRVTPVVDLLSQQLGTRVTRAQAFDVVVKEAVERRER